MYDKLLNMYCNKILNLFLQSHYDAYFMNIVTLNDILYPLRLLFLFFLVFRLFFLKSEQHQGFVIYP